MDLLQLVNGHVFPSVHALVISPFKEMWENDTSEGKQDCLKDFAYIELLCSPKKSNPYHGRDEEERVKLVKKEVYKDENYSITSELILATLKYKECLELSSPSYPMYDASRVAANKLRKFLLDFNLEERTPHGAMVLKPKDVTSALKEIPDTMKGIEIARLKVNDELTEDSKTRNDRKIGSYEE